MPRAPGHLQIERTRAEGSKEGSSSHFRRQDQEGQAFVPGSAASVQAPLSIRRLPHLESGIRRLWRVPPSAVQKHEKSWALCPAAWRATRSPPTPGICPEAMELSQMIVQATTSQSSPLMQLPHFTQAVRMMQRPEPARWDVASAPGISPAFCALGSSERLASHCDCFEGPTRANTQLAEAALHGKVACSAVSLFPPRTRTTSPCHFYGRSFRRRK